MSYTDYLNAEIAERKIVSYYTFLRNLNEN
jgi:hypothetical protein